METRHIPCDPTLYQVLGIPLDTHYQDATGRPVSIVAGGKPVHELL